MRYIGDVHGKFGEYAHILDSCKESIQVGDLGVGFPNGSEKGGLTGIPPQNFMIAKNTNHRFIRGNHDNPFMCRNYHSQFIQDGTIENDTMFIGGARSIDASHRIPGVSYWDDEELDYYQLDDLIRVYEDFKPRIMITHECPESIARHLFPKMMYFPSVTRQAFDVMHQIHKPELWIFGHWHENKDQNIFGTRFICLAELSYVDI